jgi:hypothetical protein
MITTLPFTMYEHGRRNRSKASAHSKATLLPRGFLAISYVEWIYVPDF